MKKTFVIIFLIVSIISLSCSNRNTTRVSLTQSISVEIPVNYKMTQDEIQYKKTIYIATFNYGEIFITNVTINGLDTLSLDEKKKHIETNLQSFMKPFNGRNLKSIDSEVNGVTESDFNFEFDKKDKSFIIFGRIILQDSNYLFLTYKSLMPVIDSSLDDKEFFFNSIKYKN